MNEFIQIWALCGDANLNLTTHEGRTTVSFNCTVGQPGAPHSLPPFHVPTTAPFLSLLTVLAIEGPLRGKETGCVLLATRLPRLGPLLQGRPILQFSSLRHQLRHRPLLSVLHRYQMLSQHKHRNPLHMYLVQSIVEPITAVQEMLPLLHPVKSVAIPHTGAPPE